MTDWFHSSYFDIFLCLLNSLSLSLNIYSSAYLTLSSPDYATLERTAIARSVKQLPVLLLPQSITSDQYERRRRRTVQHKGTQGHAQLSLYSGSTRTFRPILNLAPRRRLHPGRSPFAKELRYRLNKRLGGPHSRSGRFEEENPLLRLPIFEPRTVQRQPTSQTRRYRPYRTCYIDPPAIWYLSSEFMKFIIKSGAGGRKLKAFHTFNQQIHIL